MSSGGKAIATTVHNPCSLGMFQIVPGVEVCVQWCVLLSGPRQSGLNVNSLPAPLRPTCGSPQASSSPAAVPACWQTVPYANVLLPGISASAFCLRASLLCTGLCVSGPPTLVCKGLEE